METQTFDGLGIEPEILATLAKLNFTAPTPIQKQAIPVAIAGNDVIGIAQTGTGKTLAFGIPTIQKLLRSRGSALIILPTRELALQVDESLSKIAKRFNLSSAVLIGGANMNTQMRSLKANPRLIVCTPGRLIDHLERKTVKLDRVETLVLDEADRMLDMGFAPQIKRILQEVPQARQTMLFSATMPTEIVDIANRYMKTPLRVEVAPAGSATENVTHEIFFVKDSFKLALLDSVLKSHNGSTLVFSRTKHGAKRIAAALRKIGFTATEIHSNRTLSQRLAALEGFKQGRYRVMVATDIAARGIDVKGIELVVNYDLPDSPEDYVHRIGRTGRAENLGHAISFATPKQAYDIRIIERLIKKPLPVSPLPELALLDTSLTRGASERQDSRGGRDDSRRREPRDRQDRSSRSSRGGRDNSRRGSLPSRSARNLTPAQKGESFYQDFGNEAILAGSTPERHPAKQERSQRRNARPAAAPARKQFTSVSTAAYNELRTMKSYGLNENEEETFVSEPFMNANQNADYRKPFGTFKPKDNHRGGAKRSSSPRGPRRSSGRAR